MSVLGKFNGLTLRYADELADVQNLEDWIKADDAHRDIFSPFYFVHGPMGEDDRASCYALEDEKGVVFYIRLSRVTRVRMQFPPEGGREQKARILRGLFHGMAFLENHLAHAGCDEWIFDTESPKLKSLAQRLLGFTESTHELVRGIPKPGKETTVEEKEA